MVVLRIDMGGVPQPGFANALRSTVLADPVRRWRVKERSAETAQQRDRIALEVATVATRPGRVANAQPQEGHPADCLSDAQFQRVLRTTNRRRSGAALSPRRTPQVWVLGRQRRSNVLAKDGASVVPTATTTYAAMLRQAMPQGRPGMSNERVCSDSDNTPADTGVGSIFAILKEEVHPTNGPRHAPVAIAQPPDAADPLTQSAEYQVEPLQIFEASCGHGALI